MSEPSAQDIQWWWEWYTVCEVYMYFLSGLFIQLQTCRQTCRCFCTYFSEERRRRAPMFVICGWKTRKKKKMCDCVTSTKDSREIRCIQTVSEASIQFAFLVALVVHKVHMVTNFKTFEDMDRKNGHIIYTWVLWSHGSGKHELGCKVAMCRSVFVIAT